MFCFSELFMCCLVSAFDASTIIKKAPKILDMVHSYADRMGNLFLLHIVLLQLCHRIVVECVLPA